MDRKQTKMQSTKNINVLLIDDSECDHIITDVTLKDLKYHTKIFHAYNITQAIKILNKKNFQPDLIILDMSLETATGDEFLLTYSQLFTHPCKVILLSTSNLKTDKEACLRFHFVKDYLLKPLTSKHLDTINKILDLPN